MADAEAHAAEFELIPVHERGSDVLQRDLADSQRAHGGTQLVEMDRASFELVFATNVTGAMLMAREAAKHFIDRQSGNIINISSDAGVEAYETWGGYGASKAALDHVSRVLAAEQPTWRVLAVDPGDMRTQMHQDAFPGEDISDRPEPATVVPAYLELIRSDRLGPIRIEDFEKVPHARFLRFFAKCGIGCDRPQIMDDIIAVSY